MQHVTLCAGAASGSRPYKVGFAAWLVGLFVLGAHSLAQPAQGVPANETTLHDLVFVTEDLAPWPHDQRHTGCDAMSVFPSDLSSRPFLGVTQVSPGRIAVNAQLTTALASPNNWQRFLYVLWRRSADDSSWRTGSIVGHRYAYFGGVVFLPDGKTYLVSVQSSESGTKDAKYGENPERIVNQAPYYVRKFRLPASLHGERKAGPMLGSIRLGGMAVEILPSADGTLAHVLTHDSVVHTIDTSTMEERGAPIEMASVDGPAQRDFDGEMNSSHATLSADGRYLVANRWGAAEINVADLVDRKTWTLSTTADTVRVGGVALNRASNNGGLLALHGGDHVAVFEFQPKGPLVPLGRREVEAPRFTRPWGPQLSIAWNGDGSRLVAASSFGGSEFAVTEVTDGGRRIGAPKYVQVCNGGGVGDRKDVASIDSSKSNFPNDIWTLNSIVTPEPTATATVTPSSTATLVPPSATVTRSATPTPSATASASSTAPATPTRVPVPVYLPIALKETCSPEHQRSDIALVIDTSSSMTGQKIADAREAALAFVGMIDLAPGRSQVTVVRYDREAEVVQELTRARATLEAAIRSLRVRSGTHIDKGLRAGLAELQSPRHIERNTQVLVLLTDGVQTGTPGEELKAAAEVRAAGVRVYAIGLGADVDELTLRTIAGADERYYIAPDSGDLARIYGEIAVDLMCPGTWGRR